MKSRHLQPTFSVLLGASMISFSGVWVVLAEVPSTTSAFYRVLFGFLFLLIAHTGSGLSFPHVRKIFIATALCGFTFALDLYFWHASMQYIGPGLGTILSNFQVFFMAACGMFFLQERLKLRFLFSLPLAFFGLFLLIGFRWSTLPSDYRLGIFYGFLTALAYTVYLLLLRNIQYVSQKDSRFTPMMLISFFTALFLAVYMLATDISFAIPSLQSAFSLTALGLCSQAIGWILIAGSLPKMAASMTGLILLLQPSLAFIWDVLFFARPTDSIQWLGAVITLSAIYLGLTGSRKK